MNETHFLQKALALKPLFRELMSSVDSFQYDLAPFCIEWGKYYPDEPNTGIMFYGRAVNGWITIERDVDKLFDMDNPNRIFACDDQMTWVDDCAGPNEGYNSNTSAFWRVIRRTASAFYPEDTLSHIIWSNVCKVAPAAGGNPDDSLYYAQLPTAQKIMKKEIEIFSPKHVVLLTGEGWAKDFLFALNGRQSAEPIRSYEWGDSNEYKVRVYKIENINFYLSEHPQCKNEATHVNALVQAIQSQED